MAWTLSPNTIGILPSQYLRSAIEAEIIVANQPVPSANIQPASLDLRLGAIAYKMRCSFMPHTCTVFDRLALLVIEEIDLSVGATLEPNQSYLIPLQESLNLPPYVYAKANPKSSTGRIDVFARVITDYGPHFDDIRPGYKGPLYLEVIPQSFGIRVKQGTTLNQLRLSIGSQNLLDADLYRIHQRSPLVVSETGTEPPPIALSRGLVLGLDLSMNLVGLQSKNDTPILDLTAEQAIDPAPFWDSVTVQNRSIILAPQRFYLLMSDELICIPPQYAAEMTAYDPTNGELRAHYAGFFDPGFGYSMRERGGTKAVLEVRAHDVTFMVSHRQAICRLVFEKMIEPPEHLYGQGRSSYHNQMATLSKHFIGASRSLHT